MISYKLIAIFFFITVCISITQAGFIDEQKAKIQDKIQERIQEEVEEQAEEMFWEYVMSTIRARFGR